MRPKLLRSFIVVVLFWFVVSALWWSLQQPNVQLGALYRIEHSVLARFIPMPKLPSNSIFQSLRVQLDVLSLWTVPLLIAVGVSIVLGFLAVWIWAHRKEKTRQKNNAPRGEYAGLKVSRGEVPTPTQYPREDISLAGDDDLRSKFTPEQLALMEEILGTMVAHPDAFAGVGVATSLAEHTVELVNTALQRKRDAGMAALAAASFELGKLNAFLKIDGSWREIRPQGVQAGFVLGTLPALRSLPPVEREALLLAVRYRNEPRQMPEVEGNVEAYRLAWSLLTYAEEVSEKVVESSAVKTISESHPDSVFDTFMQELPSLAFQNRGLPRGVAAVAWKVGSRIYFLETKLRQILMEKVSPSLREALSAMRKGKVHPVTESLLRSFAEKGWLVREVDGKKVGIEDALWVVKAGRMDFNGVIIVDVPAEVLPSLPSDDTHFMMEVIRPLFMRMPSITAEDVLGSVLAKPKDASS